MQVLRDFCALSLRCHRKQPWRMMKLDEKESPMSSSFRTAMSALLLAATCSVSSLAAADPVRYELDGVQQRLDRVGERLGLTAAPLDRTLKIRP
mgnify:CR=1 FL=1